MKKYLYFGLTTFLVLMQSCTENQNSEYYGLDDYATVEKYDSHVHINSFNPDFLEFAKANRFRLLSLNVAAPEYVPIEKQQDYATEHRKEYADRLAYTTSFHIENLDDSTWQEKTIGYLRESFARGASGVKVWKNIGMEFKDKEGHFVMIDDPRLDPIWDFIEKNNKTLVGHLGEPKNCWLPLDKMTVKNDREYFAAHAEYHMYLHPEFPSYEKQIEARDNMLAKHPGLRFDGAHLGSVEWSLDELAKRLDKFPNMAVDMAERISHIQYQTVQDHKKVYDFFIKYQDRLLYSTDLVFDDSQNPKDFLKHAGEVWKNHWAFFTSDQIMEAPEVSEKFTALHLPRTVIDKLYRKNAEKWFPSQVLN
ncbi:amidohydrolase family protein [Dyadobacter sp. 32]|uniref:amidohydrolase family protein n=1 Tax=Dyadobacter sp. 32 TaxID=538966 RepID=UPI0039C72485